ncbi:hypothetical protein F3I02_19820 [Bacillus sp. SRB3LM]|nr:hypothetical protein [Bacillus sp. SRB3LM]
MLNSWYSLLERTVTAVDLLKEYQSNKSIPDSGCFCLFQEERKDEKWLLYDCNKKGFIGETSLVSTATLTQNSLQ